MSPKVSKKRSVSTSAESRQSKRARVNLVSPKSGTSIPADKALSKTETNNDKSETTTPKPKLKIILTLKKDAEPSNAHSKAPSKATQERSIDASEKASQKKKSARTSVRSQKSTTTGSVDDAPSKKKKKQTEVKTKKIPVPSSKSPKVPRKQSARTSVEAKNTGPHVSLESVESTTSDCVDDTPSKTKPEAKKKTDAAPPVGKMITPKPLLPKPAASPAAPPAAPAPVPAKDVPSTSEVAQKQVSAIRKRSNDVDEAIIKTKAKTNANANANANENANTSTTPRTNQFVPINTPQPNSRARKPFREPKGAENSTVDGQTQPNNTEDELKSEVITNELDATNTTLPKPPPRDPVKSFGSKEKKAITVWMRVNNAAGARGNLAAFRDLLYTLGCLDPSFDHEILANFHHRIERYILRIKKSLKECGAVLFQEDDKLEMEPIFADWTVVWLEEDWDGVIDTRVYYTDNYLEKYSPTLEGENGNKAIAVELPVDEPFEEEAEILYVESPDERIANLARITNTNTIKVRVVPECDRNPYGMADWWK
ncbi:hypothetical protein BOTCAL_0478g00090 [Botryotinia calthae]|uniref:Uncharacterized protein n=1 Tax=Botryotinia calthae TaxID=38488 RepID=A0A4Y8CM37_9HELO|nr:hypothetical protein BOTCAL_0478g00090 [Botryotinia calthae]